MKLDDITEDDIWDIADSSSIVARGLNYFETGQIAAMDIKNDKLIAKVYGSYGTYDVEIRTTTEGLEADCDCPYDGYGCKHIVAVLYNWINKKKDIKKRKSTTRVINIDKELSKLSKDELRSILLDLFFRYEDIRLDILLKFKWNPDAVISVKDTILCQIKDAFYIRDGFIDYNTVFEVVSRLEEIKERILLTPPKIRTLLLKTLVEVSFDELEHCDDSSGQLGEFIIGSLTLLGRSIHEQKLAFREKKKIIQKYFKLMDEEEYGLQEGYIGLILEIPSTKSDFDFLINKLKDLIKNNEDSYNIEMYKSMLIESYHKAGFDDKYLELLKDNVDEKNDFLPLVKFWQERGELEKAVEIAENGIKNKMNSWDKIELYKFLENKYKSKNNKKDLLRILILHFKNYPVIERYKEIKEIAEDLDKWDNIKPELIKAVDTSELVKIFLYEKKFNKAYELVINAKENLSDKIRDKVALSLINEEPVKALTIYFPIVQEYIDMGKRDTYRLAALYGKKIKEIYSQLGEDKKWENYIRELRSANKKKRAMIEEFRRL